MDAKCAGRYCDARYTTELVDVAQTVHITPKVKVTTADGFAYKIQGIPISLNVRSALIAGTIASLAMSAVQTGMAAAFERNRPDTDRDEETEAISALVNEIANRLSRKPSYPAIDGTLLHYLFGGTFGLAYSAVRKQTPVVALGRGAAFGVALWIASDLILIRAIGLVRNDRRYSIPERANAFASHLAYGMVLETVLRALESRD